MRYSSGVEKSASKFALLYFEIMTCTIFLHYTASSLEATTPCKEGVCNFDGAPSCENICRMRFALERFINRNPKLVPKLLRLGKIVQFVYKSWHCSVQHVSQFSWSLQVQSLWKILNVFDAIYFSKKNYVILPLCENTVELRNSDSFRQQGKSHYFEEITISRYIYDVR